jgi:hypothetical protein
MRALASKLRGSSQALTAARAKLDELESATAAAEARSVTPGAVGSWPKARRPLLDWLIGRALVCPMALSWSNLPSPSNWQKSVSA